MDKILKMTLQSQWFNMILDGIKTEEYRAIKQHWLSRLTICKGNNKPNKTGFYCKKALCKSCLCDTKCNFNINNQNYIIKGDGLNIKHFNYIRFYSGGHYSETLPNFIIECKEIIIGEGNKELGAIEGELYFVIKLGKIIEKNNINE